tara:strand:+ start:670 stop:954 length:285 start_codon:yes stop_codon:yes gene_type:complete
MDFDDDMSIFNSVSVVITPHEKGFTCGIIDPKPPTDRDLCSYIAKGIVRFITTNADIIYEEGMQGFYDDDVEDNRSNGSDNVIDLFNFKKGDLN